MRRQFGRYIAWCMRDGFEVRDKLGKKNGGTEDTLLGTSLVTADGGVDSLVLGLLDGFEIGDKLGRKDGDAVGILVGT